MDPYDLIDEQDQLKANSVDFVLWRKMWEEYDLGEFEWATTHLKRSQRKSIPNNSGIYTLLIQPRIAGHPVSYLLYVGKATSLLKRFRDYLTSERRKRSKIIRLLLKYDGLIHFCCVPIGDDDLDTVERALITAFIPPCNDQLPAQLGPVRRAF